MITPPKKIKIKKTLLFMLKILFTLFLLYIILKDLDFSSLKSLYQNILIGLIVIIILNLLSFVIMALKWWILVKNHTDKKILRIFNVYWASDFASLFLPGFIGSEAYKIYISKNKTAVFATSMIDRLLSLGIYALLSICLYISYYYNIGYSITTIFFILIVIITVASYKSVLKLLIKKTKFNFLKYIRFRKKTLKLHILLSIIYIFSVAIRVWVIFLFLGYNLTLDFTLLLSALVVFAVSLPITYQGFGARETVFIFLISTINLSAEIGLAASLMYYFANLSYRLLGAIPFVILKKEIKK
jgi:uncharacterized membrane protein YbhN (UPF0104 family)